MKLRNTLPTTVATIVTVASVVALSFSASVVQAQTAAPKAEKAMMSADDMLRLLDKNGDGVIDREEAKADPVVDKNFTLINKSGSGKISRDELDAFMVKK